MDFWIAFADFQVFHYACISKIIVENFYDYEKKFKKVYKSNFSSQIESNRGESFDDKSKKKKKKNGDC